jgi:hypothetical protein
MESKKINQLATELAPELSDLTIIGDPTTGISKKITLSQMASLFTGTVEEYASLSAFPLVGAADTIYIALDTNIIYRWNTGTSAYVELSPNIVTSLVFNDANGFDGTISLVGSTATLTITTALTTGSVGFIGASGALLQDNANFFWDNSNKRLGINTNTPTTALDVFGSGIIGRINGTSTNNAFLGFASAGTNKWSIGNVQSDHRFRIYNEATTSELVSVLQTGEFGIGIANPTTKLHIDGGASALIANLDANISVAKSISFRSDNSARINLEVSGTESGSNAGANFYLRTYTDAGSLLDTPFEITRATGTSTIRVRRTSSTSISALILEDNVTGTQTNNVYKAITSKSNNGSSISEIRFLENGGTNNDTGLGFYTQPSATNLTLRLLIDKNGLSTFYSNVTIGNQTTNATLKLYGDTSGGDSYINFNADSDQTKAQIWGHKSGSNGGVLELRTLQSGTLTTSMYLNENGRIGIGTSTPIGKFSVKLATATSVSTIAGTGWDSTYAIIGNPDSTTGTSFGVGTNNSLSGINLLALAPTSDWVDFNYYSRNHIFYGSGSERMRLTSAGGLAINTTSDSGFKLYVNGTSGFENTINMGNASISWGYDFQGIKLSKSGVGPKIALYAGNQYLYLGYAETNGWERVYAQATSGGVYLTNGATSWTGNSDERLKNINSNIENAVEKLNTLRTVKYSWKEDELNREYLGLIAQDVLQVLPEIVDKDEKDEIGTLGVRYTELIPVLVAAIKELNAKIK